MSEYTKTVNVLEGPWERMVFKEGSEQTHKVLSRKVTTTFIADGHLCEETALREYVGGDYNDNVSSRRILKLNE